MRIHRREHIGRVFELCKQRELEFPVNPVWLRYLNSETTMIFGEICVRVNRTVLRISELRCQIATDFFTKTAATRLVNKEKYFLIFLKLFELKKVTQQFRMSKWFDWKFLEGYVHSACNFFIKISFPKLYGHFKFQSRYPNRSNSSR